jgi:putative heme-binding domain-containing protein
MSTIDMSTMRITLVTLALVTASPVRAADEPKSTLTPEQTALAKKVTDMLPERTAKKETTPGQQVFTKAQCAACHTVDGGDKVGPTLQGIGRRGTAQYIIESILEPTKVMVPGYEAELIETEDDSYIGFVKEEGDKLKIIAQNIVNEVPKKDVKGRRKLKESLMPKGLEKSMTPGEFADLVVYLLSLDKGGPDPKK